MTITTSIQTAIIPSAPTSTGISPTQPDPRPLFARAAAIGRQVIEGIRPDQFTNPTPCTEFDVRQLSGHLISVLNRIAVLGAGGDFFTTPQAIDDVADTAWVQTYQQLADTIETVWSDDAVLAKTIDLPWAQMPGAMVMMIYINEVIVHTWDLAAATGQHPNWDGDVLQMAFVAIQGALPAEGRSVQVDEAAADLPADVSGLEVPFAEVVPVADDAPLIDRLVAWNGRKP